MTQRNILVAEDEPDIAQLVALHLWDEDFNVTVAADGKAGTWVVGGRSVKVTENTDLDEDHSPLKVGACADAEMEDGVVEEIESEPPHKCVK